MLQAVFVALRCFDKWPKFGSYVGPKNTPPFSFHTMCVKKLVNAQWESLVMIPMTHRQTRMPPPCSGSRCALGSPSGETLPPQRVRVVRLYSSQACSPLWIFPWENVTSARPAGFDSRSSSLGPWRQYRSLQGKNREPKKGAAEVNALRKTTCSIIIKRIYSLKGHLNQNLSALLYFRAFPESTRSKWIIC